MRLGPPVLLVLLGIAVGVSAQETVRPGANVADNPRVLDKLPKPQVPPQTLVPVAPPLWGWADLHAHPASHLSFGADGAGNNGIFWGKPGLNLERSSANVAADMPACAPDKHGGFDADVVRHKTHQQIIGTIDNLTGGTHSASGGPDFQSWPSALSLTHQQMHVTSLRRAYDGGQRLMVASVTNNQMLSLLWERVHFDPGGAIPLVDPEYDYRSAKRQLTFIKELAAANPAWMEVALSAADARRIIAANKLAVILSLEMDSLTADQIMRLVNEDGVRHVIPIHLINNTLGGAAVYSDAFNAANNFVNGGRTNSYNNLLNNAFYQIVYDTKLRGRLNRPQTLVSEGFNLVQGGAVWPRPIDDATYARLQYDHPTDRGGHRNRQGLTQAGQDVLKTLFKRGLLVDIVHMSQESAHKALQLAVTAGYPVMNSHTGLRGSDETAENERALLRRHAATIGTLGGVIGLGTEGTSGQHSIVVQTGAPLIRFTGQLSERDWQVSRLSSNPAVSNLTVRITTGGDDLRGGNNRAWARVTIAGRRHEFDLSQGQAWGNGTVHTVTFALPRGTRLRQIDSFGLRANPHGKNGPFDSEDNWNVDDLTVHATLAKVDTVGTWLAEYKEILGILNGRGVALGTDINGFAPQMSYSAGAVTYPLSAAGRYGVLPKGYRPPALARSRMGNRTFDFQRDGIAHYGMLADFVQAVSQSPGADNALGVLFRSADQVVVMWEKCETVGRALR